jgi:septal ring factor EnvC (AmiA/AmiB activator)
MLYTVERMTEEAYNNYMMGMNDYFVEVIEVEAESVEEAIEKASITGYVVNTKSVKTIEEVEREKKEKEEAKKVFTALEEAKKEKRRQTEKAQAENKGMTVEEYKAYKANKRKLTYNKKQLATLEKELAKIQKMIEFRKEEINKLELMIND